MKKEMDAGVSRRSDDELDYTTFGELSVIITSNWGIFGSIFNSKKAVEKVFASLNALRNPIAHCCPLAEDEELRLRLTVRDWFRLMER
ncbi:Swt1 family HEPN domain-containing protein [Rhizobium sp. YTUHZ045]|uniref:Swt1 family HEPN domain-containing protein n=1 Tax=Rhizobium sp. YTUHZ045 TaxID=2962888 RepID=UPI003DA8945F